MHPPISRQCRPWQVAQDYVSALGDAAPVVPISHPRSWTPRAGPVPHRYSVLLPGELCEASTVTTLTVRMRRQADTKGAASYPLSPSCREQAQGWT